MEPIEAVVLLLAAVALLTVVARRIGVPYPILMVLGGLALGFVPGTTGVTLEPGQRIRLGGLVEKGTIVRDQGTEVEFSVTDTEQSVKVAYSGILPDLFREEQGVITEGSFGPDGVFVADSVLAKHDENYMPKEVADSLKEKGVWQEETQ